MRWRALLAATAALAGCGDAPTAEDVPRFDARDAVVEESPDVALSDVPGRFDVIPSIDVIALGDAVAFDAGAAAADDGSACQAVSEDYAAAVRAAQTCRVDGECDAPVCETLCCACRVFVSTAAAEFARLGLLRERWAALGCATMGRCAGGGGCGAAVAASCAAGGRCVTVRERGDGGASDAAAIADAGRMGVDGAGLDASAR